MWTGLVLIALILAGLPLFAVRMGRRTPRRAPAEPARGLAARYDLSVGQVHTVITAVEAGRLPRDPQLVGPARELAGRMLEEGATFPVGKRRSLRWLLPLSPVALMVSVSVLVAVHRWNDLIRLVIYALVYVPLTALLVRQRRQRLRALRQIAAGEQPNQAAPQR